MGTGLWSSESSLYGQQYAKGKSSDELLEAIKKLSGEDYDPLTSKGGFDRFGRSAQAQYRNLFEPVRQGKFGGGTGEMKLKAGHGGRFGADNAKRAATLREQAIRDAFHRAVGGGNLFSNADLTQDELAAISQETGYGGKQGVDKWVKRTNKLTGETETVLARDRDRESNFYRRYKKPILQGGAGLLGFLVGGPGGAMLAASLAGTARDIKVARDQRREVRDARRDWENEQRSMESLYQPEAGNLFRASGEGVVEYATDDISKKKRDQLVRRAT